METILKVGTKNYKIDLAARRIDFLDNRFYFDEDGTAVPSVTTLLEAYPKGAAFYEWLKKNGEDSDTIRDEAGRKGSVVHGLTESYDNGLEVSLMNEDGYIEYKMIEWAMFERYVDFRKRFPLEIINTELSLVSKALGFAGTLDRLIKMNGKLVLLDIKTSGSIWPSYWLQLAAYKQLFQEQYPDPIDEVAILWLNSKTKTDGKKDTCQGKGWQLISKADTAKDWQLFKATQQLWLAENGSQQPKEFSYQLTHKLNGATNIIL